MSLVKSIPLTLSSLGGGAMNAIPSSQESYYGQQGSLLIPTEFPVGDSAYYGALSTDATNSSIGTYTDTFYNEAVGTHPGSSLSTGSTTTTLYQNKGDSVDAFAEWYRTVAADSSGDIYEMDSDSFLRWGKRLLGNALSNEDGGCFRLSSYIPGGTYETYKSSVFEDTLTNGSTAYNLYRKRSTTGVFFPPTFYTLQLKDSDQHHIKEMSDTNAIRSAYFAMRHAEQNSGLGDYLLLSDSDGTPADQGYTGTWVARGVALDTRNTTQILQYLGTFTTQFTGQYTGNFTGQYTGFSVAPFSADYSGVRTVNFTGVRGYSSSFGGSRNYASVVGQYDGSRNYASQYEGVRQIPAQFIGQRTFISAIGYSGSRNYSAAYSGSRNYAAQYGGSRNYASVVGQYGGSRNYTFQYTGGRQTWIANPGNFNGDRQFTGTRDITNTQFISAQFEGTRSIQFTGQFAGSRQFPFAGTRTVGPTNFTGTDSFTRGYTQNFIGFDVVGPPVEPERVVNYSSSVVKYDGVAPKQYAGQRTVNVFDLEPVPDVFSGQRTNPAYPQQFAGVRVLQYTGTRSAQFTGGPFPFAGSRQELVTIPGTFAGSRNYSADYSGSRTYSAQYGGSRNYASVVGQYGGSRNYTSQYAGSRQKDQTFSGQRPAVQQFAGSRNYSSAYSGSRNYSGSYAGVRNYEGEFLGPLPGNFAGERIKNFTGQYSGVYNTQFTGQYTGSFSSQFAGETLTSTAETIHTYTLYCRVSET